MPRWLLLIFALLAGCGQGPQADLQYIKQARSTAAEWALVNDQANAKRVTSTYADSMHRWLHDGLESASSALTQRNSPYAAEIRSLLNEPAGAAPERLRAHAEALKRTEDQLESA